MNLEGTYWDEVTGFFSEFKIDSRWTLRDESDTPYGSLRVVSHPNLPPGHLRSIFTYITKKSEKTKSEILQTVEDYLIDIKELEVFSIDEHVETNTSIYDAPLREIEELFGVKVMKW